MPEEKKKKGHICSVFQSTAALCVWYAPCQAVMWLILH